MEALYFYILLLGLAWILSRYFIPRIKNLPPTPLSAISVLCRLHFLKQPIHLTLSQIATRHGPILLLRFGVRRVLLISSASAAEDLFSKHDVEFANRPKMVAGRTFGHDYTKLAWAPYDDNWKHLRNITLLDILPVHGRKDQHVALAAEMKLLLCKLFGTQKDETVESKPEIQAQMDETVESKPEIQAPKDETVNLKPEIQEFVCNVMTRVFAGERYCHRKKTAEGDKKEAKGNKKESISLLDYATESFRMTTAELDKEYFMPIRKFLSLTDRLEQNCNKLQSEGDASLDTIIKDIRNRMSNEDTVIQRLLDKQSDKPKSEEYSNEVIRGLVLELLSAGTDTTAGTIEWALSLLINHRKIMKDAQDEIFEVAGDQILEPSDIEKLPYLKCIVKETMRLYPVAPLLVPHESSEECKVGGYNVPKRTMLLVNVWAIQNDPKIWDKPTEFMPERFMGKLDESNGFNQMPFGYGLRSCPGKDMALRVIAFALGSLIHCFDWETNEKSVDMTEQRGLALLKDKPLMAKYRPRSTEMKEKLRVLCLSKK